LANCARPAPGACPGHHPGQWLVSEPGHH